MTGSTIAGTNRFPVAGVSGFHQCVLASYRNKATQSGTGTFILTWGGTDPGVMATVFPAVVQDTDGFSGIPGNMQMGGPAVTALVVPEWLGGTYDMGIEQAGIGNAWWIISGSPPYPNPQPGVPYIPSNGGVSLGDQVVAGPVSVAYELRVNGAVIASYVWAYSGGFAYVRSEGQVHAEGVALEGLDVVTSTVTAVGIGQDNALGGQWPGESCGFMYLTRTGGGRKSFLRGHVAL